MTPENMNTVLVLLNFFLAASTVCLAVSTWRMAAVSKASFDLESRPYFAFKRFIFKFLNYNSTCDSAPITKGGVRIGLVFRNPGRVLISYQVKNIRLAFFWDRKVDFSSCMDLTILFWAWNFKNAIKNI